MRVCVSGKFCRNFEFLQNNFLILLISTPRCRQQQLAACFFFFSFHRKSTTRRRLNHEYLTCRISQGKCSQLVGLPHRTLACPSWRLCSKLAVQIVAKVVNTHRLRRAPPHSCMGFSCPSALCRLLALH